jgi:hypothetical protein
MMSLNDHYIEAESTGGVNVCFASMVNQNKVRIDNDLRSQPDNLRLPALVEIARLIDGSMRNAWGASVTGMGDGHGDKLSQPVRTHTHVSTSSCESYRSLRS